MKSLIASVLSSMERDKRLAESEPNRYRKAFYASTSAPFKLEPKQTSNTNEKLRQNCRLWLDHCVEGQMGWSYLNARETELRVTSKNPLMVEGTIKFTLKWHHEGIIDGMVVHEETITLTRPIKFSTLLVNHIQPVKNSFVDKIIATPHALKQSDLENIEQWKANKLKNIQKHIQEIVKKAMNEIAELEMWVYFTTTKIPRHYKELSEKEDLRSCMSKSATYYGNTYLGKERHPLQGYEYAPDFRLALVSPLSPDEIKNSTTYPFIARVMVFPTAGNDKNIGYAKAYGNEKVHELLRSNFSREDRVRGLKLYGVVCDYADPDDPDTGSRYIKEYYDDNENISAHVIAPFVDEWNNCLYFDEDDKTIITREDGVKVVRLVTGNANEDDEDGYYSIFHGSGILQWSRYDREEIYLAHFTSNGKWVVEDDEV